MMAGAEEHSMASFIRTLSALKSQNLKVESWVLFGGSFQDFKPRRQHLK